MPRRGIVDLGANTARLVVFDYEPGEWFRLVDEVREPVRLGAERGQGDELSETAMERAVAAIKLYSAFAVASEVDEMEVIATSAVREASNRDEFLARVSPYRLPVTVLSGEEEAELGVLAVTNGFDLKDAWVLDLGGGSIQVSLMKDRAFSFGRSFPLGVIRLKEIYLQSDPPPPSQLKALEKEFEGQLKEMMEEMRATDFPIVAMGGTIRNLSKAVQRAGNYPLNQRHGYFLERQALDELTGKLLSVSLRKRARVRGINPDRADIIVGGARLYGWILSRSRREGLWVSTQGVREGAFYRQFLPAPHLLKDIPGFSVRNLFFQYRQQETHTWQVRWLSRRLFEGLQPLHQLEVRDKGILDAAAWLHDIGMAVGYRNHHKHGEYLVGSQPMNGFTHREQGLVSLLVRYHRKGAPTWGRLRSLARPGDKLRLLRLATCLRLAEYLERARGGRVRDLSVEIEKDSVKIHLLATEEPFIEVWETRKQAPLFERAFKRRMVIRTDRMDR